MNRQELIEAIDRNSTAIYYTAIFCTVIWIIIGTLSYRYIVEGRPIVVDHEEEMISGFYKRDVKIKMDSISNALMIQTLRHQLLEKQMQIDSLGKALATERKNSFYDWEYESDERIMFMKMIQEQKSRNL
jgi:lipid A disaccharide synthetase